MRLFRKPAALLSAIVIGFLAVGCGEGKVAHKVAQCNKLSEIVNSAAEEAKKVAQPGGDQLQKLATAADSLDNYAKQLEELELSDEQLQGFKTRFVAMYKDTSTASRSLLDAVKNKDQAGGQKALSDLQAATGQETSLVQEVNSYCGAGQ